MEAGKVAIGLSLLSKEDPGALYDFGIRDKEGIYHFFYNSLTTSWEEFKQNKLTIVTFNYDRSLEYFMFTALKHSYNKSDVEVAEAIQSIPIIHVHGSLGPLPWQASGGIDYSPFFSGGIEPYEMGQRIKVASENIVIVSEAQPKSKEFVLAFEKLKEAERIYFLGFGYFNINLERLGLSELKIADKTIGHIYGSSTNIKVFSGSALGLGAAQMKAIENYWHIALPDNKSNALEFLKEYADLA